MIFQDWIWGRKHNVWRYLTTFLQAIYHLIINRLDYLGVDWEYLKINPHLAAEFVPVGDGTFEMIVVVSPTHSLRLNTILTVFLVKTHVRTSKIEYKIQRPGCLCHKWSPCPTSPKPRALENCWSRRWSDYIIHWRKGAAPFTSIFSSTNGVFLRRALYL